MCICMCMNLHSRKLETYWQAVLSLVASASESDKHRHTHNDGTLSDSRYGQYSSHSQAHPGPTLFLLTQLITDPTLFIRPLGSTHCSIAHTRKGLWCSLVRVVPLLPVHAAAVRQECAQRTMLPPSHVTTMDGLNTCTLGGDRCFVCTVQSSQGIFAAPLPKLLALARWVNIAVPIPGCTRCSGP